MEKVFITGATGFIGSGLVRRLAGKYRLYGLALKSDRVVTGTLKGIEWLYGSLDDYRGIRRIIVKIKPDYVIHLGAAWMGRLSYEHYIESTGTNYLGSVNLMEACRAIKDFKQFIAAGSSDEYGTLEPSVGKKISETTHINPNNPYAVAKAAVNLYLNYLGYNYCFPYTFLRPFNTYGRDNSSAFFIEGTINQMLHKKEINLGNPDIVRDWLYVDDHVDGYVKALGNEKAIGKTIQLCTGRGYSIRQVAGLIAEFTNFKGKIHWNALPQRPTESLVLVGNNGMARKLLGWKPRYTIRAGLKATIEKISNSHN